MAFNPALYPPTWNEMRAELLARAGNCCEGSPAYPDCRAANHQPHPITGSRVVLTVAHLYPGDAEKRTTDLARLRVWCQRCHLFYDLPHHMAVQRRNRDAKRGQRTLEVPA